MPSDFPQCQPGAQPAGAPGGESAPVRILCVGDVVGRPGRRVLRELLPELRRRHRIDFTVVNGENAAGGFGLVPQTLQELLGEDIDVITSGNHIWDKKEVCSLLEESERLLRPLNFPEGVPGRGWGVYATAAGHPVGVINAQGRVFMTPIECPFRQVEAVLPLLQARARIILVDFHAEATSEKVAFGRFLDGRVTAVFGTHTHVQTADEQILPGKTAYITDLGMTGPHESVIGMDIKASIQRFLTGLPGKFEPENKGLRLNGLLLEADPATGRALRVERINLPLGG